MSCDQPLRSAFHKFDASASLESHVLPQGQFGPQRQGRRQQAHMQQGAEYTISTLPAALLSQS